MASYAKQIKALLSPAEGRVFERLGTPNKIQNFLDSTPNHFSAPHKAILSPTQVLKQKKAHCFEGALLAAAALAYHGHPPLLMDFQTAPWDEDHVVALFKERGLWGAISKTNHPVLRWRDPIYRTPRELAMSYAHEYYMWHEGPRDGEKTLRAHSVPFNLRRYAPHKWLAASDIDWLADELDSSRHFPIAPAAMLKKLRKASKIERQIMCMDEWNKQGKKLF